MVQKHLSYNEMTNFGCFYTPQKFVDIVICMIKNNVDDYEKYVYVDSSCGYGTFLKSLFPLKSIGCDIDADALNIAKSNFNDGIYYNLNSLHSFSRNSINLNNDDKIIIVGNPPYNDTTSKVKNEIKKQAPCEIDNDIKTRDLGISFLLSYAKLNVDYVAVLHPLSYMIKKANFDLLKRFYDKYALIDHCIVNSQDFSMTSKTKGFPIIIALYKKTDSPFTYNNVQQTTFKTIEGKTFGLAYDNIKNYVAKYPSKYKKYSDNDIFFFTMRDINALNRSRTFIVEKSENAIIVDKQKFHYYCYVDIFKDYINRLPYYLGNCDVFINNSEFLKIKDVFVTKSIEKHPWLKEKISYKKNSDYTLIDKYFKNLFDF